MDYSKIIVLGVRGHVIAFNQETGERLWTQALKGSMERFITVVADTKRVYAHTNGQMFCLDLSTGQILWQDGLAGLGYGVATLAIPGQPAPPPVTMAMHQRNQNSSAATTA